MINKAVIMGRIGNKDVKTTKGGKNMTSLSLATNRKYLDAQGAQHDITTWHTVYFFNKIADIADKYTEVGDLVYIEGEISNRKIEDDNGTRWIYSINGSEIKLLPNKRDKSNVPAAEPRQSGRDNAPYDLDEDIPF